MKFYDRKEIKDIIAYLRIILTPTDGQAWKRIINVPPRKIGPTTVERTMYYVEKKNINYLELESSIDVIPDLRGAAQTALKNFYTLLREIIQSVKELPVRLVINKILEIIHYQEYLEENFSPPEAEAKMDTINELKNLASRYDTLPPEESLMHFLEDIALITAEQENDEETDKVILMTAHSAKGLEFEHVIIAGAEEGLFPHSRTLFEPDELEEERRLWYVAMTRAKKKLVITRATERYSFGTYTSNIASRFVGEIPGEYTQVIVPKSLFMSEMIQGE